MTMRYNREFFSAEDDEEPEDFPVFTPEPEDFPVVIPEPKQHAEKVPPEAKETVKRQPPPKKVTVKVQKQPSHPDDPVDSSGKIQGKFPIVLFLLLFLGITIVASVGLTFFFRLNQTLPTLGQMQNIEQSLVSKVLSNDGELVHEFTVERRYYVPLSAISPTLQQALIAIEDRRFYKHWGIDLKRIFGATIVNVVRGHYAQGGSTLTQQLAKNVYLTARSSLIRKLREALTAIQLESCYTKNEILELYMNQVYLGAGVYGFEAASLYYFNKQASELNLNESATLAGLVQLPERYRPDRKANLPRITERRNKVLAAMYSTKQIDKRALEETLAIKIESDPKGWVGGKGSYFIETVRKYVADKYGDDMLYNGGLTIHTTLDPVAQDSAESSAARQIKTLQERLNRMFLDSSNAVRDLKVTREFFIAHFDSIYETHEEMFKDLPDSVKLRQAQISVIALDVETGAIRVMIGGRNFEESKFNRALFARRQPGSSFKPFVYAAAMDNGYSPSTVVLDQPITLLTPDGEWRPENYDHVFNGPITIRKAVARSVNLVAIQVLNQVGPQVVINYARKLGLNNAMKPVPALAIGACEATPVELTSAYSAFANRGIRATPYCIEKIVDKNGRVLETHTPHEEEALSAPTAYLMCSLLRTVVCCGTGAAIPGLGFTRPAAGKTGTTNNYSDAWFVGFTPQIACGVWTGIDERRSMGFGTTGGAAAIPVWVRTMIPLHRKIPVTDFHAPEKGIKSAMVCEESHLIATPSCPNQVMEVFKFDAEIDTCALHGSGAKKAEDSNIIKLFSAPKTAKPKSTDNRKRPLMF